MVSQLPERSPHEPTSRPALQFSLITLFILTTMFAVTLSVFFGLSQFLGISALEFLTTSVSHLIYAVPKMIVWSVGLTMAVRRLHSHRKPAILTAVALAGSMLAAVFLGTIQVAVIASLRSGQVDSMTISWILAATSLTHVLIDVACWILILMAIFSDRPAGPRPLTAQTESRDPFDDAEPAAASIAEDEDLSAR
jgi:hypothetical protein